MTPHPVHRRKMLIEVAIPLEAINAASAREKSIRHGHPSTLHLRWARRPLAAARAEIRRSWSRACGGTADHPEAAELFNPEKLPGFHDPFAGGGALPLEAQRLGLEAYATDLNPVAVLINKASIEMSKKGTISILPFGGISGIVGLYSYLPLASGPLHVSLCLNLDNSTHIP